MCYTTESNEGFKREKKPHILQIAVATSYHVKRARKNPTDRNLVVGDDMPVWEDKECNKRLIDQVAEDTGQTLSSVEAILNHFAEFTANTIRSGSLEGVCFPYLGKFQVKLKDQQYKAYLHSLHPVMKKEFQKAPAQNVNHLFTDNPDNNEEEDS